MIARIYESFLYLLYLICTSLNQKPLYHIVLCVQYRRKLLKSEVRCEYLKHIFREIAERYWFALEEMGTDGDRVHLFMVAVPKYSLFKVI